MKTFRSMVLVSNDPGSIALGSNEVYKRFESELLKYDLQNEISLNTVSDLGRNDALPIVIVYPEATIYGPVKPEDVSYLVEEHLYKGRVASSLVASTKELSGRIAWLQARQGTVPAERRIVLEHAGLIDPEDINDYIIHDGYSALGKVLAEMSPEQVYGEIEASGLKGRGGAGFPTGTKWKYVARTRGAKKYVICNADESEPGTFKDRLVLEGDPHSILEAMLIAGYAVGAEEGYLYIRGEYALAQERIRKAIEQASEMGFIGKNIFGSNFSFDLHVHSGAGAYICG
jgi:NADP-reducing hydrogenase subunit HndC